MDNNPGPPRLRVIRRTEEQQFEIEVAAVLRERSPEGAPASPEAQRRSLQLLIAVLILEGAGLMYLGWRYFGIEGIVGGAIRAAPVLMAAHARRKDRLEAEEIVRERWRQREKWLRDDADRLLRTPALPPATPPGPPERLPA